VSATRGLARGPLAAEVLAWLALLVCVRQSLRLFEVGALDVRQLLSSDSLFIPDLVGRLRAGHGLAEWSFPHATFLIPDAATWFLIDLFRVRLGVGVVLFAIVQVVATVWVTKWIVGRLVGPWGAPAAIAAWCAVLAWLVVGEVGELADLLKLSHHQGAAVVTLLALGTLSLAVEQGPSLRHVWLLPLVALGTFSDGFVLTCFVVPALAVLLLAVARSEIDRGRRALCCLLLTLAGAVGHALSLTVTHVEQDVGRLRLAGAGDQLQRLGQLIARGDALFFAAVLVSIWLFVRGVSALGHGPGRAAHARGVVDCAPLAAMTANTGALVLTGNIGEALFSRHQLVVLSLVVLAFCRVVAVRDRWVPLAGVVGVGVAVVAAVASAGALAGRPVKVDFGSYRPPLVDCLQGLGVRRGLADFWNARVSTLLSEGALQVDPIDALALPHVWLNDAAVFRQAAPLHEFVVLSRLYPESVRERFGPPQRTAMCGSETVWLYDGTGAVRVTESINRAATSGR
jgi:hypothetical protein